MQIRQKKNLQAIPIDLINKTPNPIKKNNGPAKSIVGHLFAPLVRVALLHCSTFEISEFFTIKQIIRLEKHNQLQKLLPISNSN